MRCNEFSDRLNQVLDNRGNPVVDPMLCGHAHHCAPCRQTLGNWGNIERVLLADGHGNGGYADHADETLPLAVRRIDRVGGRRRMASRAVWITTAAAACWIGLASFWKPVGEPRPLSASSASGPVMIPLDLHRISRCVREPEWWGAMAAAGLKPVEPLASGFRPLTNSFQSALQILTPHSEVPDNFPTEEPIGDVSKNRQTQPPLTV
jgi:hypothetical protein